jgi:uncharacterized protein (TIGR03790 family)
MNRRMFELKLFLRSAQPVALVFIYAMTLCAQDNVLVVINETSADSTAIGRYYASRRGITHVCSIRTADTEKITREVFDREILHPIADCLRKNSLQDQILYIVTTRGVPLIVDGDPGVVGDLASVDSELTLVYSYLLTGNLPYQGRIENPYYAVEPKRFALRSFLRKDFDIYLVTRLTSMELVDRALKPDAKGDFYFDLISPRQSMESEWVQEAAAALKMAGFKTTVENTAIVLSNLSSVQGYVSQQAIDAPTIQWCSGAIATILDKEAGKVVDSYVASGVTGFGSYIADPMLDGYFRPEILFAAYTAGFNLAESFYAASRYLSWHQVVIGDPLVAPYAKSATPRKQTEIDPETGLPQVFAKRKIAQLMRKYSTSRNAVVLFLKAEVAESNGDRAKAMVLVGQSLEQDPLFSEASELKSRLAEVPAPAPKSVETPAAKSEVAQKTAMPPSAAPETVTETAKDASISLDFPARLISKAPIKYPADAKLSRVEGVVVVDLVIDEMGQVMKADIVRGDRRLARAVLDSVKLWRFEPELENGRPIMSRCTIPVTFRIKS